MQSQPLPTSWTSCGKLPTAPRPHLLWVSLCMWVSQLPSSPSIYPVPLDLAHGPEAHLCVQTPQELGDQLKHIARKY